MYNDIVTKLSDTDRFLLSIAMAWRLRTLYGGRRSAKNISFYRAFFGFLPRTISRPDRDIYVSILWDNILPGKYVLNYLKMVGMTTMTKMTKTDDDDGDDDDDSFF